MVVAGYRIMIILHDGTVVSFFPDGRDNQFVTRDQLEELEGLQGPAFALVYHHINFGSELFVFSELDNCSAIGRTYYYNNECCTGNFNIMGNMIFDLPHRIVKIVYMRTRNYHL